MSSTGSEVHLAIYDLSQGMARSLSAQFLGNEHAIDIIPHTGIVVFGKEYYFGSMGIESSDPSFFRQTRGIHPIESQFLGRTNVTQERFEAWCRQLMENGSYAGSSYDLLHRNCNNFSHHAAIEGLGLTKGTPDWVLGVPQRFLSSPMGQMMRPMLEQMQLSGPSGGGSSMMSNSTRSNNVQPAVAAASPSTNPWAQPGTTGVNPSAANPWANYPSSQSSESEKEVAPPPKKAKTEPLETPVLSSHSRPLLSNDTKMVPLCVKKIKAGKGLAAMDEKRRVTVLTIIDGLSNVLVGNENKDDKKDKITEAMELLMELMHMDQSSSTEKTFTLMIIRLMVLQKEIDAKVLIDTMQSVKEHCINDGDNDKKTSTALRSMSWCVLSNAVGCCSDVVDIETHGNRLDLYVDAAIADLSFEKTSEIRQSAAAFLYNLMLYLNSMKKDLSDGDSDSDSDDHLSDLRVMILCGVAEGLSEETDEVVLIRRLLVVGKIVRNELKAQKEKDEYGVNHAAASLLTDLGYTEVLSGVPTMKCGQGKVPEQLVAEILKIVSFTSS